MLEFMTKSRMAILLSISLALLIVTSHCDNADTAENVAATPTEFEDLSAEEVAKMRESASQFTFKTDVHRVMKLIINSLYRNKEIFLRELISNASDAIDKIRLLALTNKDVLGEKTDFAIQIKSDHERHLLTITDSGIGMTKEDLVNNLGTIAKSGTADFMKKLEEASDQQQMSDLIGQFGVGFYSAFLVADKVIVTTKHNDDDQYIWESDSSSFSITKDPRGNALGRGTAITLVLKEEAYDFLNEKTLTDLIRKYSQFINFDIYMWASKTETVEEPIDEDEDEEPTSDDVKDEEDKIVDDDAAVVEDDTDAVSEDKPKTKKVEKTTWDWELVNDNKPIWTRKPADITDDEYNAFYKAISKDNSDPLTHTHFVAEGEVTFKSLLYVPTVQPSESFNRYGTSTDNIKLYVRRVFITDDFNDMLPNYLSFLRGLIDSDDLPLNVSRETLQQHKLLKVIKKKLVRKALDMFKKMDKEKYDIFWKEYSTNIKLGILEDTANKSRLAKLLRFLSSSGEMTSLAEYIERMKDKQDQIFFMAGSSKEDVEKSPFVERLLKRGYEVLYLVEAIDEYAISALPEFEGKKFQNVAKEGFSLESTTSKKKAERVKELQQRFEPLTKWLAEDVLKEQILRAELSERLDKSPCALITSRFGWTANMQRIVTSQTHAKSGDMQRDYYLGQKKALEINPRHPLIRELLRRVEDDSSDKVAADMAKMMFDTAVLRSGYMLKDTSSFANNIEVMMRQAMGVDVNEAVEEEVEDEEEEEEVADDDNDAESDGEDEFDQQESVFDTSENDIDHEEL